MKFRMPGSPRVAAAIAMMAVLFGPGAATAQSPEEPAEESLGDPSQQNYPWTVIPETLVELALLRPLGAAATAAGLPMFLVSVPFMAPSGETGWSWDVFVMAPFDYTFTRPFRDF